MVPRVVIFICFFAAVLTFTAQSDSIVVHRPCRKVLVGGLSGVAAGTSLVYLQKVWYSDYNTGAFHFFNDNGEWQQMDKAGHFYTSYQTSRLMMDAFEW